MDMLEKPVPRAAAAAAAANANVVEPTASAAADMTGPSDEALLGLPPGVSAPAGAECGGADAFVPVPPPRQIEWYHLDPDENYQELRLGTGPGLWRGIAF